MTRRAARAVTRAYDTALAPTGLTASQFTLLAAIASLGTAMAPATVARLSASLLMESSTLSRNLQALRDRGYLRWTSGSGRRAAHISLSDTGKKALAAAIPAWQDMQRQLTQRLGSGKAGALLENLEAAATALSM
ncbi:MAG: MarR family transcriptional regulator [Rhodospirillaceae bacterium]|nr:MAG: MarR family transcriptional regulator [Rhodospirillaceae bacterium]